MSVRAVLPGLRCLWPVHWSRENGNTSDLFASLCEAVYCAGYWSWPYSHLCPHVLSFPACVTANYHPLYIHWRLSHLCTSQYHLACCWLGQTLVFPAGHIQQYVPHFAGSNLATGLKLWVFIRVACFLELGKTARTCSWTDRSVWQIHNLSLSSMHLFSSLTASLSGLFDFRIPWRYALTYSTFWLVFAGGRYLSITLHANGKSCRLASSVP